MGTRQCQHGEKVVTTVPTVRYRFRVSPRKKLKNKMPNSLTESTAEVCMKTSPASQVDLPHPARSPSWGQRLTKYSPPIPNTLNPNLPYYVSRGSEYPRLNHASRQASTPSMSPGCEAIVYFHDLWPRPVRSRQYSKRSSTASRGPFADAPLPGAPSKTLAAG